MQGRMRDFLDWVHQAAVEVECDGVDGTTRRESVKV